MRLLAAAQTALKQQGVGPTHGAFLHGLKALTTTCCCRT